MLPRPNEPLPIDLANSCAREVPPLLNLALFFPRSASDFLAGASGVGVFEKFSVSGTTTFGIPALACRTNRKVVLRRHLIVLVLFVFLILLASSHSHVCSGVLFPELFRLVELLAHVFESLQLILVVLHFRFMTDCGISLLLKVVDVKVSDLSHMQVVHSPTHHSEPIHVDIFSVIYGAGNEYPVFDVVMGKEVRMIELCFADSMHLSVSLWLSSLESCTAGKYCA